MKKILFLCALFALSSFIQKTNAKGFIPIGSMEKIEMVADLPNNDSFKMDDGKYLNIGSKYTVYTIAWLPIYTIKTPEIVGYSGEGDSYYEINKEEMDQILSQNHLQRKDLEKMSFWNAWGGKIVAGIIIILLAWAGFSKNNKEEKEISPKTL